MCQSIRLIGAAAALALVLRGMREQRGMKSSPPATKATTTTTPLGVDESSLTGCKAPAPDPGEKASEPRMSVDPCENLAEGQMVKVSVVGFTAGKTVGINECSDKTDDTGSGCDLEGLKTFDIGKDGTGSMELRGQEGPVRQGRGDVHAASPSA